MVEDMSTNGIPQSKEELEKQIEDLSSRLGRFGLGRYEARAYLSLIAHGYGTADTISETAGIPRTSAYTVLEGLISKGFAISTEGRPKIYKPEPPSNVKSAFLAELDDIFTKLEFVHEIVRGKGTPQLVFTITGREKVMDKIKDLLNTSTKEFMISTPRFTDIYHSLEREIENAVKRRVKVTVITRPGQKALSGMDVIRVDSLIATDVIADNERALIASHDLAACGYTDDRFLASHLSNFLMIAIAHSKHSGG
jgi:sugar-specific transcriptional regulator TrmB